MTHDILIISDPDDKSASDMIARRLRALKFKVRNNRAPTKAQPTAKDLAEVTTARAVLALWSETSTDASRAQSAWLSAMVQAAAAEGNMATHARLDDTAPHPDFTANLIHDLQGLTGRKLVPAFSDLVELLGASVSRPGLNEWLALDASDKKGREGWLGAHPNDPLNGTVKSDTAAPPEPEPTPPAPTAVQPRVVIPPPIHAQLNPKRFDPSKQPPAGGELLLAGACLGILLMFVAAFFVRSEPFSATSADPIMPPFAAPCRDNPDDPRCREPLQPTGPIIDDTQ